MMMKKIILIILLLLMKVGYSQEVTIELISVKKTADNKLILTMTFNNNSNKNYAFNKNYSIAEGRPDFSAGSYTKINLFVNDSLKYLIPAKTEVKEKYYYLDKEKKDSLQININREIESTNSNIYEIFFIKKHSKETITFCLNDYLNNAEMSNFITKIVNCDKNISIGFEVFQSGYMNIKDKKMIQKMKTENFEIFIGNLVIQKKDL